MSKRKRDRKAAASAPASAGAADSGREPGRFSARRKTEMILRLLRGEPLDGLARELGVTAATLAQWREAFLTGGQAALKSRPADERDDEIQRLRVGRSRPAPPPGTCRRPPAATSGSWSARE